MEIKDRKAIHVGTIVKLDHFRETVFIEKYVS